jgi:NAD(P)-dependent dehydrogenase (short-subunit alcohol dehydrogenase family)
MSNPHLLGPGTGRVAVITGGTRGVGLAAAEALANDGFSIAIAGHSDEEAREAATSQLRAYGVEVSSTLLDVKDLTAVAAWVREVEAELGPIGVAVAAAGNLKVQPFLSLSESDWDETIDSHVKGTFALLQSVARLMVDSGRDGSLITMTSFGGLRAAGDGLLDYSTAKGAIVALTRTLAKELIPYRIRVNCVLPAADTRMTETLRTHWHTSAEAMGQRVLGGVYEGPSVIGPVFSFLGGAKSRWITGQIISADGGFGL